MSPIMFPRLTYFLLASLFLCSSFSTHALVVLQYHHVDDTSPESTSISPKKFLQHMQLIEDLGLEVVDLELATRELLSNKQSNSLPSLKVAISFDDAYSSIFDNAYPELKRRNWPFTVFVNTQPVNHEYRGIMTWSQIKELVDDGVTIANHSVTHAHLPILPADLTMTQWLDQEILVAQQELQRRLGKIGNMLAYPYGEFTLEMIPWLEEHDMLAFGQQSGPIGALSHPQALSRFPASGVYADVESLKTKLLSLALPIEKSQLHDPIVNNENNPPALTIRLSLGDYDPNKIQCFASQQGAIETQVEIINAEHILTTQASKPLGGARGRYNCTVISPQKGRFYWYSQPWQFF
ncbi:MAG: peptidoglycan/xylan/chitin deacetylase (PgdA/CDA1 family) [Oleispira sp.]|jgi:peptidoglycan/xylan/chitin deacetylase (PgdA/CDA1 family)